MADNLREADLTLQLIFTPHTFRYLAMFTTSLIANSDASFRLVANGCDAAEVEAMRRYAERLPSRLQTCRLTSDAMVPHGVALDELYETYDDGSHFCFIDTDVKARGPFLQRFMTALETNAVVTSGRVAWSDDAVLPLGSKDLAGRHFVGPDGFVYGSSYVAFYDRAALREILDKYRPGFRAVARTKLSTEITNELTGAGQDFDLYDTAKVVNILLHANGYSVFHFDHDELLHVGGISQYLSHPRAESETTGATERPWFAMSGAGAQRWDFAQWTAETLMSLVDGRELPELPLVETERAELVQRELRDLYANDVRA